MMNFAIKLEEMDYEIADPTLLPRLGALGPLYYVLVQHCGVAVVGENKMAIVTLTLRRT